MLALRRATLEAGDLSWRVIESGPREAPAVLFLHGFTGAGAFWEPVAGRLPARRCIMPDLPGHGGTAAPVPAERWSLPRATACLASLLQRLDAGPVDLVGYSMGGRLALQMALEHPDRVRTLVLAGASPGIDSEEERRERRASDARLAGKLEQEGIEAFVAEWESLALFASQAALARAGRERMRAIRLGNDASGLAAALRAFGAGDQEPLSRRLPEIDRPVLLVAGALDAKYSRIAREMAERLRDARVEFFEGLGHAVPFENPEAFASVLQTFIAATTERRGKRS